MPLSSSVPSLFLVALVFSLAASQLCDKPVTNCDPGTNLFPEDDRISIKHANKTITKVEYDKNFVDVDIQSDNEVFKYRFIVCGCSGRESTTRQNVFINPLALYIQETPSMAMYHFLAPENINFLKAVPKANFIFNSEIRSQISNGAIDEVAEDAGPSDTDPDDDGIDYFKVRVAEPVLSIISTFSVARYRKANLDIPFLVAAENQEQNPLGRAEWIKLFGLILDRSEKANKEFEQIEKRYDEAKKNATRVTRRPAVFFNHPGINFSGSSASTVDERYVWTQPVADEYIVQLVVDANADYRYIEETPVPATSGRNFNISTIVRDFTSADYLIQSSSFPGDSQRTLEQYLERMVLPDDPDPKAREQVEKLKAVRCATVWSHQKRVTESGEADDFFESAALKPDEVLKDFLQALHPDIDFGDRETEYIYRYEETKIDPKECPFTVLMGTARDGFVFVDKKFKVPGLDRFQIADRLEDKVFPAIREAIDDQRFDVFFLQEDASKEDTYVTVRVEVKSSEEESFKNNTDVARGMIEVLGRNVRELNEDGSEQPVPPDPSNNGDGGLSGGAIAGIVIGVILLVVVIGGLIYIRRSRTRRRVPAAAHGTEYWDAPDSAGRGDEGYSPFA